MWRVEGVFLLENGPQLVDVGAGGQNVVDINCGGDVEMIVTEECIVGRVVGEPMVAKMGHELLGE